MEQPLLAANTLLSMQLLLLDAGLLIDPLPGLETSAGSGEERGQGRLLLLPWAMTVA